MSKYGEENFKCVKQGHSKDENDKGAKRDEQESTYFVNQNDGAAHQAHNPSQFTNCIQCHL